MDLESIANIAIAYIAAHWPQIMDGLASVGAIAVAAHALVFGLRGVVKALMWAAEKTATKEDDEFLLDADTVLVRIAMFLERGEKVLKRFAIGRSTQ